jgi:hypothetical protein
MKKVKPTYLDALYDILLSKYEFCNNWFSERHTLLKGIHSYLPLMFIFLDKECQIRCTRLTSSAVGQVLLLCAECLKGIQTHCLSLKSA